MCSCSKWPFEETGKRREYNAAVIPNDRIVSIFRPLDGGAHCRQLALKADGAVEQRQFRVEAMDGLELRALLSTGNPAVFLLLCCRLDAAVRDTFVHEINVETEVVELIGRIPFDLPRWEAQRTFCCRKNKLHILAGWGKPLSGSAFVCGLSSFDLEAAKRVAGDRGIEIPRSFVRTKMVSGECPLVYSSFRSNISRPAWVEWPLATSEFSLCGRPCAIQRPLRASSSSIFSPTPTNCFCWEAEN